MLYLLDANIFIQAQNFHYSMDFCPAFWDFLKQEATKTMLASTDMVYNELKPYDDEVSIWAEDNHDLIFTISSESEEIQKKFMEVAAYVSAHPLYKQSEKDRFLGGADPWLIATASVMGVTIVTHEVLAPSNTKKVKIPNVSKNFGVSYCSPFEMIRQLGGKFNLC